jgi:hypothetical protein
MAIRSFKSAPLLAVASGSLVVGLAMPAAAKEASHLVNGASIKKNSISGDRLKAHTVTGRYIAQPVREPLRLLNGYTSVSDAARASYTVDAQGYVHLQGTITDRKSNTSVVPFVLPSPIRPSYTITESALSTAGASTGLSAIHLADTGKASLVGREPGENTSLDGVTYFLR